ncbi:uncharacterized protein LOC142139866 [Mixophyes fleayi]|uniref:uncharacterized protein LOC142139866 n=1 Tax=Mixophyes fleayi TaxID=3061075 RepID=UPI003F4DE089
MSYGPIHNPPVPFSTHFHSGICDGTLVVINGTVLPSGDRFAVNFQCGSSGKDDIAFHLNPRFDGGVVVCNTKEHQNWGKEENKHELPFHRGQAFEIRILVTSHDYKVSVNRNHFLEYHHRIPIHRVNTLEINGCITLACIDIQSQGGFFPPQPFGAAFGAAQMHNPNQFPSAQFQAPNYVIPYQTNIYGGLFPSKVIVIRGTVSGHPKRFHVNLKFSGGTALHFNPRFDECTIVRNSFLNNSWGKEERQMPSCGMCFASGQSFVLEIICEPHHFKVNVNGNHVCNFNHRVPNLQHIDTLQIEGDVVLQHVQVYCHKKSQLDHCYRQHSFYCRTCSSCSAHSCRSRLRAGRDFIVTVIKNPGFSASPEPSLPSTEQEIDTTVLHLTIMSYGPIHNPPVPFSTYFQSGICDGTLVVINGTVLPSGDRFAVNFQCGTSENDDIAFHLNPRFDGGVVVCNTKEHQIWGKQEDKRELPFHRGQPFEIQILVTSNDYKVSVNRNHFLEYYHRIPIHRVNTLEINGCITIACIDIQTQGGFFPPQPFGSAQMQVPNQFPSAPCQAGNYPNQFPSAPCQAGNYPNQFPSAPGQAANYVIPYQTNIYGGLFPSKVIVIRGTVSGHPKRFHVNLNFSGGTALQFNPRFDECTIVRNTLLNNSWGKEERQMPSCGMCFAPGQSFVLEIICEPHHFKVNVNGNHVCNFNHRVPNLQHIDTLQIEGDVVLQHVQV